jgi:predicted amidophosphoribosyltransferase
MFCLFSESPLTQLLLSKLEYGALLSYSPRGDSAEIRRSQGICVDLKRDRVLSPSIPMSQWVAQTIQQNMDVLPFASFFQSNTILVPVPTSSLMQQGTLWVPERLATALVKMGLGKSVYQYLIRFKPVRKSASSAAEDRPKPAEHYESLLVQKGLVEPNEILLIDDIVTRGSTLLGAASRLFSVYLLCFTSISACSAPSPR